MGGWGPRAPAGGKLGPLPRGAACSNSPTGTAPGHRCPHSADRAAPMGPPPSPGVHTEGGALPARPLSPSLQSRTWGALKSSCRGGRKAHPSRRPRPLTQGSAWTVPGSPAPLALRPAPACCVASGECLALSGLRWLARGKRCRRVSQGPLGGRGGRKHRVGADTAPRARPMAAARPALLRPPRGVPESHSRPRAAERGSPACPPLPLPAFSQGPWPPRPTPGARGACLLPWGQGLPRPCDG